MLTRLRGEEIVGMQPEWCADADHPTWRLPVAGSSGSPRRVISEGIEPRECKRNARGTNEATTVNVHG